ncbi:MAG TPA: hypothetical protein VL475_13550 [Planctomycetaceae bacterium]|nr:hypothetical protein [Planctomycetaceae bacterium]
MFVILGSVVAVGLAIVLFRMFREPPQIGTDEETFATVDALFTALTTRDERRLADCETRLAALRQSDRLSAKAAEFLDEVIQEARSGQWEPAARRLYDFMYGQRRENS